MENAKPKNSIFSEKERANLIALSEVLRRVHARLAIEGRLPSFEGIVPKTEENDITIKKVKEYGKR